MAAAGAIKMAGGYVELFTENSKLNRGLSQAENRLRAFSSFATQAGTLLFGAGAAISGSFAPAVGAAAKAEAELSKFGFVFRDQAEKAEEFVGSLSKEIGRADVTVRKSMITFQAFFQGMDFDPSTARVFAQSMSKLQFDFASFFNIPDDQALRRFISALSGSSEVMDQYGVNLKQASLDQALLARGFPTIAKGAGEAQKAIGRMDIILNTLKNNGAVDNAKDTMHGFDNQVKITAASMIKLGEAVGKSVIERGLNPLMSDMRDSIPIITAWVEENQEAVASIAKLGAVSIAGGAAMIAIGQMAFTTAIGISALSMGMTALAGAAAFVITPVGALTLAVAGLTGGLIIVASQSEAFWDTLSDIDDELPGVISEILNLADAFGDTLGGALTAVSALLDGMAPKFSMIGDSIFGVSSMIGGLADQITIMNHEMGIISESEMHKILANRGAKRAFQLKEKFDRDNARKNGEEVKPNASVSNIYDALVKGMKESIGINPDEIGGDIGDWIGDFKNAITNANVTTNESVKKKKSSVERNRAVETRTEESQKAIADFLTGRQGQKDEQTKALNNIATSSQLSADTQADIKEFMEKHGLVLAEGKE